MSAPERIPWVIRHGGDGTTSHPSSSDDAMARRRLPPGAIPQPERFSHGHRNVKLFIFRMRNYLLLTAPPSCTDRTLVRAFVMFLSGPALAWAVARLGPIPPTSDTPDVLLDDFDAFLDEFAAIFGATSQPAPCVLPLLQDGRSIDEYIARFFGVLAYIDYSKLVLPQVFYDGLDREYKERIGPKEDEDITALIDRARQVGAQMDAERLESGEHKV
ncbi:uncharacterized protein V1518DRAFT_410408 [Limtongia smithiae]|uniref:uncharacterized protein n=1 Tax=Limtongia smithiae TaxID=1125753 RepID=UPI0034CE6C2B